MGHTFSYRSIQSDLVHTYCFGTSAIRPQSCFYWYCYSKTLLQQTSVDCPKTSVTSEIHCIQDGSWTPHHTTVQVTLNNYSPSLAQFLQYFDAVGWVAGRASSL